MMKDEIAGAIYAKEYTNWYIKCGGYARDMTLRDHLAAQAMFTCPLHAHADTAEWCYARADAMLKERNK